MAPKPSKDSARAVQQRLQEKGIVDVSSWGDWSAGDKCGIEGEAGVYHIQGFRLFAPKLPDLVIVVGGPVNGTDQVREYRTFIASRLTTKIIKRARKSAPEQEESE